VRVASSFSSPRNTPQPAVSLIQRAAGRPQIRTVGLPATIGNEGGIAGGGPACGGCIGPRAVKPVHVTKSPKLAAGMPSMITAGGAPGSGGPINPEGTSLS
jgi:hypothetical protein